MVRGARGLALALIVVISPLGSALAATPRVKVSGNIALIPRSSGVTVAPLPKRSIHVSWKQALRAAKASWGLETKQVEVIVRAAVTDDGNYAAGWAVVADLTTHNPAPGNNTVYTKMVIMVSGSSGNTVFSYPTAPDS